MRANIGLNVGLGRALGLLYLQRYTEGIYAISSPFQDPHQTSLTPPRNVQQLLPSLSVRFLPVCVLDRGSQSPPSSLSGRTRTNR